MYQPAIAPGARRSGRLGMLRQDLQSLTHRENERRGRAECCGCCAASCEYLPPVPRNSGCACGVVGAMDGRMLHKMLTLDQPRPSALAPARASQRDIRGLRGDNVCKEGYPHPHNASSASCTHSGRNMTHGRGKHHWYLRKHLYRSGVNGGQINLVDRGTHEEHGSRSW
jgi:hypothetical protein